MLGTAAVLVGIVSVPVAGVRGAAFLLTGMWWWTLGKMGVETGTLPRSFGLLTAAAGVAALAATPLAAASAAYNPTDALHIAIGLWLLLLGRVVTRPATR